MTASIHVVTTPYTSFQPSNFARPYQWSSLGSPHREWYNLLDHLAWRQTPAWVCQVKQRHQQHSGRPAVLITKFRMQRDIKRNSMCVYAQVYKQIITCAVILMLWRWCVDVSWKAHESPLIETPKLCAVLTSMPSAILQDGHPHYCFALSRSKPLPLCQAFNMSIG